MKENMKRFLALILSFVMILTSVPVYANPAAGQGKPNPDQKPKQKKVTILNVLDNYTKVERKEKFELQATFIKNKGETEVKKIESKDINGNASIVKTDEEGKDASLNFELEKNTKLPKEAKEEAKDGKYVVSALVKISKNETKECKWYIQIGEDKPVEPEQPVEPAYRTYNVVFMDGETVLNTSDSNYSFQIAVDDENTVQLMAQNVAEMFEKEFANDYSKQYEIDNYNKDENGYYNEIIIKLTKINGESGIPLDDPEIIKPEKPEYVFDKEYTINVGDYTRYKFTKYVWPKEKYFGTVTLVEGDSIKFEAFVEGLISNKEYGHMVKGVKPGVSIFKEELCKGTLIETTKWYKVTVVGENEEPAPTAYEMTIKYVDGETGDVLLTEESIEVDEICEEAVANYNVLPEKFIGEYLLGNATLNENVYTITLNKIVFAYDEKVEYGTRYNHNLYGEIEEILNDDVLSFHNEYNYKYAKAQKVGVCVFKKTQAEENNEVKYFKITVVDKEEKISHKLTFVWNGGWNNNINEAEEIEKTVVKKSELNDDFYNNAENHLEGYDWHSYDASKKEMYYRAKYVKVTQHFEGHFGTIVNKGIYNYIGEEYKENFNTINFLGKAYGNIATYKNKTYQLDDTKTRVSLFGDVNDPTGAIIDVYYIDNPITINHVLYFDSVTGEPNEHIIALTEQVNKLDIDYTDAQAVYDEYSKYIKEDYVLNNVNGNLYLGLNAIKYDEKNNAININYWARKIKVTYTGIDENNEEFLLKDSTHKIINFFEFDKISANTNFTEFLENYKLKPNVIELQSGVVYKYDHMTVSLDHICNGVKGSKDDYNVVTLNLFYAYDTQANCDHDLDVRYEDNEDGKTHTKYTDCKNECGYKESENESHTFIDHVCVCGAIEEGKHKEFTMSLIPGLVITTANGKYLVQSIDRYAYEVSEALEDYEDTKGLISAYEEREKAEGATSYIMEENADNMKESITAALADEANLVETENGYVIKNVMHESFTGNWYNLTIKLKSQVSKFENISLKNINDWDGVRENIKKAVAKEKGLSMDIPAIEMPTDENVKSLSYGNTYEFIVKFYRSDEELDYIGNVYLYHKSSNSNKKKEDKEDTIEIDDLNPQAGGALADLRNNRPNDMLTRSEFVGVLAQIFSVMDAGLYKPFEDINGDANEQSIKKFSTFEIVKGYCDEEFGPNDFITREQMYLILARAIKFSGKANALTEEEITVELAKILNGENVSDWATEGVAIAIQKGLLSGTEEDPQGFIMRSQAADKLEKFIAIIATTEEKKD